MIFDVLKKEIHERSKIKEARGGYYNANFSDSLNDAEISELSSFLTPAMEYNINNNNLNFTEQSNCGGVNEETFPVQIDVNKKIVIPYIIVED